MKNNSGATPAGKALYRALVDIDYSPSMAHQLVNGLCKPSLTSAVAIEERLGIPPSAWVDGTAPEAFIKALAAKGKSPAPLHDPWRE